MLTRTLLAAGLLLAGSATAQTYSKTEVITYSDNTTKWVLGQTASVSCTASVPASTACDGDVVTETTYDPISALPTATKAFGKLQTTATYNANGTLATIKDGLNHTTTFSNWKRGIPQNIQYADLTTQSAVVNDNGWITSVTDELSNVTSYGYDAMGRLASITYPTGDTVAWTGTTRSFVPVAAVEYGIPAGHWRETVTTGNAVKITYYDGMWRPLLVREYDAGNQTATERFSKTAYDAEGRVSFASYPSTSSSPTTGVWTNYDALGRVTSVSQDSELGLLTTTTSYNSGFTTTVTNPRNQATTTSYMAYDQPSMDWPLVITAPESATTTITRDPHGKPLSLTRSGSGVISVVRDYAYNNQQELIRSQEPETGATLYGYDAAGNLSFSAAGLPMGANWATNYPSTINRTYDARNRLSTLTFPDGVGNQTWTYYADGLPNQITTYNAANNTNAVINAYTYNKRRLLTGESSAQPGWYSWSLGYGYDANGSLSTQSYPTGLMVSYAPNALGQPTQVASPGQNYATGVSYYPNGAIKQFTYGNGIVHTMTQNVRQLPSRSTDGTVLNLGTTFDANGNVAGITDYTTSARQTRSMAYDGLDRLTSTTSPMFGTASYAYDAIDNLKQVTVSGGTNARTHYYCYNAANQLDFVRSGAMCGGTPSPAVIALAYDVQGNLANKNGTAYTFDYGNRLRGTSGQTYRYDAQGRRVQTTPASGKTWLWQYSQSGQMLFSSDFNTSGSANQQTHEQVYLAGSLVAIIDHDWPSNTVLATKFQHTDALGSPIAETNAAGSIVSTSEYEPYGKLLNRANDDRPGYTGHVMDSASGLTYMQQRYYDPQIGRFLSVDPVTAYEKPMTNFNRYVYALNNPYKFTDPDGRDSVGEMIDSAAEGCGAASCAGWAVAKAVWDVFGAEGVSQVYDKGSAASTGDKVGAVLEVATAGKGRTAAKVGEVIADGAKGAFRKIAQFVSGACSFDGQTLVMTSEGLRPIVDIKPGDLVLSRNEDTGEEGFHEVLDQFSEWHDATLNVEIAYDDSIETLITTDEHPFFVVGKGFVAASELVLGDRVQLADGKHGKIASLNVGRIGQIAYNLTVTDDHTYFVGKSSAWVHNNCRVPGGVFRTNKEAAAAAEGLGFTKVRGAQSHGQAVYTDGKTFITRDVDSHNGGAWKVAESVKALSSKETRAGTWNADLTKKVGE